MKTSAALLLLMAACSSNREERHLHERDVALTGTLPQHMNRCPSGVPSAKTSATETIDGIDVTITSEDPGARARIRSLAKLQSSLGEPMRAVPQHTGMHGGPGLIGHCPIIHAGTTVSYEEIPSGAIVHVIPRDARDLTSLQAATRARVSALVIPTS